MYVPLEKPKKNTSPTSKQKSRAVANSVLQRKSNVKQGIGFVDNRNEFMEQRKLQEIANNRLDVKQATQLPVMGDTYSTLQLAGLG